MSSAIYLRVTGTLDQLNWMAIVNGQEEISRILEFMGRMFRIGLSNGNSFITIDEEMEHLRCYMEIQQIRCRGLLQYTFDIPEELGAMFLPKMILQPFVKNAIVHGFHQRIYGSLMIGIQSDGDRLRIAIEDDGVGLRSGQERKERRKTGGYGIRNVTDRASKNEITYPPGVFVIRIAAITRSPRLL